MNEEEKVSSLLDNLVIASPCTVKWDEMTGDDRKRLCNGCSKFVHNISDMTKREAEEFLEVNGTEHCMIFYRRFDGTILTDDCPVGLRKIRDAWRFATKIAAGVLTMLISLPGALAQTASSGKSADNLKRPLMNRYGMLVGPDWKEPTPPPGYYYTGNPAGGGMILRPLSEKPKGEPVKPVTANPEPIAMPGAPIMVHPVANPPKPVVNYRGKPAMIHPVPSTSIDVGDGCVVPPLVVRNNGKDKENKLLDTKAHNFYDKGVAAQKIGRKDLAEYYYEHAIEAFDEQKLGDQKFRNELVRALASVKQ